MPTKTEVRMTTHKISFVICEVNISIGSTRLNVSPHTQVARKKIDNFIKSFIKIQIS